MARSVECVERDYLSPFLHLDISKNADSKAPLFIGLDEVGRGCLAGPVMACAVSYPLPTLGELLTGSTPWFQDVADSKKLSSARRAALKVDIERHAEVALGEASVHEIDQYNILRATMTAMGRALARLLRGGGAGELRTALSEGRVIVLVDGNQDPRRWWVESAIKDLPQDFQRARFEMLVRGDSRSKSIASASIVAKVTRDALMDSMARQYPGYGIEKHKGYSTALHKARIVEHGPCAEHRRSFEPLASLFPR